MASSIPKVVHTPLVSEPTVLEILTARSSDKSNMPPKETYRDFLYLRFPKTPKSSTKVKSPKHLTQRNHTQGKLKLVSLLRHSALVDDECKQPQEIGFSKYVSIANGTMSRMVTQNAGRLHFLITRISCALKLRFHGITPISALLDQFKEPIILSWWIHIHSGVKLYP
ncbi:unnamed protein product [Hymenolepis diminuta]|uniref:Uncharacterized protein n=1 Tax=Hymenolepis diminuta TaxID=6216 RepID=A0A564Z5S3_HYMDI|nr:unnamed protein product [Hymenolepis diminuta]